jgi:hypothetical protein
LAAELLCVPDDYRYLTLFAGFTTITVEPNPLGGPDPYTCAEPAGCGEWLPVGQEFTVGAIPDPGSVFAYASWSIPGCTAAQADARCTFTVSGDGSALIAYQAAP